MNGTPDEHPDQWIRQSLDRLPDTPPPGSTFDSKHLWVQLQPELQKIPARRRIGPVWWAAAACLVSCVLMGWLWSTQSPVATTIVSQQPTSTPVQSTKPKIHNYESPIAQQEGRSRYTVKSHPIVQPRIRSKPEMTTQPVVPIEPVDLSPMPLAETAPIVETPVEPLKTSMAVKTPKRRFQVVHLNELAAEEEARPKLYRPEHFVRRGIGTREELPETKSSPAIIIPLTKRIN